MANIEGICSLSSETLETDIASSQEFIKRFSVLKSQYETTSRCAASVEQTFKDVVLADMAQAPEILKSMTESIESDMAKTSDVQNQIADLAQKMEASKKAMITLDKI